MKIGYARESMHGQPLDAQLAALKDCDTIFSDKVSDSADSQPKLKACLAILNEGDILFITRLDRLASTSYFLTQVADKLQSLGVNLVALEQDIDTRQAEDKTFALLAALSEIEKARPHDNSEELNADKEAQLSYNQIEEMQYRIACGGTVSELCDEYNISTETFYRLTE